MTFKILKLNHPIDFPELTHSGECILRDTINQVVLNTKINIDELAVEIDRLVSYQEAASTLPYIVPGYGEPFGELDGNFAMDYLGALWVGDEMLKEGEDFVFNKEDYSADTQDVVWWFNWTEVICYLEYETQDDVFFYNHLTELIMRLNDGAGHSYAEISTVLKWIPIAARHWRKNVVVWAETFAHITNWNTGA